jgi:hypothetical protein
MGGGGGCVGLVLRAPSRPKGKYDGGGCGGGLEEKKAKEDRAAAPGTALKVRRYRPGRVYSVVGLLLGGATRGSGREVTVSRARRGRTRGGGCVWRRRSRGSTEWKRAGIVSSLRTSRGSRRTRKLSLCLSSCLFTCSKDEARPPLTGRRAISVVRTISSTPVG